MIINPLGIQGDGIITEGRGEDFSVDLLMESKGIIHEIGFNVEIAIPFKSLRFEAGKGKLWGAVPGFRRNSRTFFIKASYLNPQRLLNNAERTVGAALRGRPFVEQLCSPNSRLLFCESVGFHERAATEGRPYSAFRGAHRMFALDVPTATNALRIFT